jgi:hypothetical protein
MTIEFFRVTTPSMANTFAYVSPVVAVILGWAILHEEITIITIIAMSVILAGVAIMVTSPRENKNKVTCSESRVRDTRKCSPPQLFGQLFGQYQVLNMEHRNGLYAAWLSHLYLLLNN